LQEIRAGDDRQNREWLREVESGNMKAESAARLMRETAHG
jgi:hypothetical protein